MFLFKNNHVVVLCKLSDIHGTAGIKSLNWKWFEYARKLRNLQYKFANI